MKQNGLASMAIGAIWVYIIIAIAFSFIYPVHKRCDIAPKSCVGLPK